MSATAVDTETTRILAARDGAGEEPHRAAVYIWLLAPAAALISGGLFVLWRRRAAKKQAAAGVAVDWRFLSNNRLSFHPRLDFHPAWGRRSRSAAARRAGNRES